jgi:hypothetical protein
MNKQELYSSLNFLFDGQNEIGLNMYMILNTSDGVVIRKADIDQLVIDELKDKFLNRIKSQWIENVDLNVSEISQADNRNKTIYYYDLESRPEGLEFLGELLANENADLFTFSDDNVRDISGFVFLLGNADRKIALYKKMYPISLMRRDSVLMLFNARTRFEKVDDDIIKIDDKFDFMQSNNDLIIANVDTLERYFGFETIIRNQATTNLSLIEGSNLLEDIEPLKEMALELKFAKKIMKLKSHSRVLTLPFDRIKGFIKHHPKLRKRLRFNATETKISLDTKISKELFLKLLDDDFLKSELTEQLYESEVKDPLTNDEESD